VPQRTSDTPSDVREDAPPATEPPADTPAAGEEEAGAEDTSTRLLRVDRPAAAEESAAADEDGTAEDTSTRLLRVDPPAAAPSSGEAAEAPAEDDEPAAEDTSTRLLRVDRPTRALRIGALVGDEDAEGPRRAAPEPGKGGRTGASASGAGRTAPTRAPGGNASAAPAGSATSANETTRPQPTASPTAAPAAAAPAPAAAQLTTDVPPDTPETTSEALDVLASLSRRPMTPFRRLLKRVYVWGVFFAFLAAVFTAAQLLRPLPSPQARLSAAPSYTFAGAAPSLAWPTDGQATVEVEGLGSLGHSGADDPVPIASVTKVMTAYLVLRDHPLALGQQGPTLTVDSQAAGDYTSGSAQGESVVRVTAGEQISEYQALQMLLIPSANNVARLLGRWDAGTDAAFVQKMQSEAAALGMTKTTYTDPSGLTNTTRSTANDQLKLARLVMQNPVFRQIVSTPQFTPPGDGVMYNNNTDLGRNGVIGIKTGSSTAALGCLMFAAEQQVGGVQRLVLGVVLGQPATSAGTILQNALSASQQLVTGTEGALQSRVLLHKGDVVGYVDDGLGGRTPLVATADVTVAGWSGLTVQVSLVPKGGSVPHTGSARQVVATLVVGSGTGRTQTPVALGSRLAEPSFGARLVRLG
jgi:D-alanyl-D-alanine carboxypeptidase